MKHVRMPRVSRVEYLLDFLKVVERGYDRKLAEQKLAERKKIFEIEKNKALGRGRPFMEKLRRTRSLREDCQTLSIRLGFASAENKLKVELTESGEVFLNVDEVERRKILAQGLLNTHTAFSHVLITVARSSGTEVALPMERDNRSFVEKAVPYGIEVSQTDFDIVCELASQLELVNWFPFNTNLGRYKRVYLTSVIYDDVKTINAEKESLLSHFTYDGKSFWIAPRRVRNDEFKEILWEEYLKATKYVPRRPVFYSQLRSYVCYQLRISDRGFDMYAQEIMRSDETYRLVGSGGSLPYSRDMASLLKSLPIKTERGEYIVYLKMDKKQGA